MVRPGLLLYGENPTPHRPLELDLRPVMQLTTEVVFFKVVKKGAKISYSHTYEAKEDIRVVTLPIGYGDGYPRRLSNCGEVLIRGQRHPIVGRVCMDQCMVSIGAEGTAYNGDEVVLLGEQGAERITLNDVAQWCDGDPREFSSSIMARVPRRYICSNH